MSDYTELVKALRCIDMMDSCPCDYSNLCQNFECITDQAAAAIEDLLESVGMIDEQRSYWIDKAAEYYNQLPKRGEWVGVSPMVDTVQCSICGGQLFSAELETPYCPYCGAKMTEVQE